LDDSFYQANLFLPRDPEFKAWNGVGNPMVQVYEASDAAGLAAYVSQQVAFIENATKEAEPLLQILNSLQPNHPLVQKWMALSSDVARSKLKSPTSSLGALVQFLLATGNDLEYANCIDRLSKVSTARRNFDAFADRLQSLQSGLFNRCVGLKEQERKQTWALFSNGFNRDLSGRSPFKNMPVVGTSRMDSPPADLDDVAASLNQFDRVQKTLSDVSNASSATRSIMAYPPHIKKFEEQFLKVRQLLAPLFPSEPGTTAGYDLSVDFRVNLSDEREGGRIIDWAISNGSQSLRFKDPGKSLFWEPGMPLVVSLRIAKDSPLRPKMDSKQMNMTVEDKTVTYRYTDPWALFSILGAYRETERNARADGRSQLLRFEFPLTSQNDDGRNMANEAQARVFIRMGLSPAGKKTLLAWPLTFPTKAPDWSMP
jgi:type VI secretion system protein ImpL